MKKYLFLFFVSLVMSVSVSANVCQEGAINCYERDGVTVECMEEYHDCLCSNYNCN